MGRIIVEDLVVGLLRHLLVLIVKKVLVEDLWVRKLLKASGARCAGPLDKFN